MMNKLPKIVRQSSVKLLIYAKEVNNIMAKKQNKKNKSQEYLYTLDGKKCPVKDKKAIKKLLAAAEQAATAPEENWEEMSKEDIAALICSKL